MDQAPEIKIPPGYIEIPAERVGRIAQDISQNIRWLNKEVAYVFNPRDPEYLRFAEQCREDSKAFARALHEEFKKQGCPVWTKPSKAPATGYRKMSFLIRPPFFSSMESAKANTRMDKSDDRDNFVLHFDEDHTLQTVRYWSVKDEKDPSAESINRFRNYLTSCLTDEGAFFKENYGNWPVIAKKIATIAKILLVSLAPGLMPNKKIHD